MLNDVLRMRRIVKVNRKWILSSLEFEEDKVGSLRMEDDVGVVEDRS